jgi:hypothetical protein
MEERENAEGTAHLAGEAAERRQEERYAVEWEAEIFIPERTAMFRGQVVNVSPSGCYVRTVAWVRVPPSTEVELVFLLGGRMNRVRAEARFAQSRTGVGLRFLSLEAGIRRRLDIEIAHLRNTAARVAEEPNEASEDSEADEGVVEEVDVERSA